MLHRLAGVNDSNLLHTWPRLGASWEGFALEEVVRLLDASEEETFFWSVHSQGELDLMIIKDGKRLGFEFKYADSPKITPGIQLALQHLSLDQVTLICPGEAAYEMERGVQVCGLNSIVAAGRV
ncbi:MAG TPA: DUF4143 domain-containing protein [Verrucomicrobiales bacterium]|nr:DUF4143 domain-containing protein [Verrucomicrobiales bacterium]